jgi:hypothetical protein
MPPDQNAAVRTLQRVPKGVLMKTILWSEGIIVPVMSALTPLAVNRPLPTQQNLLEVMEWSARTRHLHGSIHR